MKQEQPDVKTIFASGYIQSGIKSEMTRHGATVIQKPYLPHEPLAQIHAIRRSHEEIHAQ